MLLWSRKMSSGTIFYLIDRRSEVNPLQVNGICHANSHLGGDAFKSMRYLF
jgi:hypothetical protein